MPGARKPRRSRTKQIMFATILALLTSFFSKGIPFIQEIIRMFKKSEGEKARDDHQETGHAVDKALDTRGDMGDLDRDSR